MLKLSTNKKSLLLGVALGLAVMLASDLELLRTVSLFSGGPSSKAKAL